MKKLAVKSSRIPDYGEALGEARKLSEAAYKAAIDKDRAKAISDIQKARSYLFAAALDLINSETDSAKRMELMNGLYK